MAVNRLSPGCGCCESRMCDCVGNSDTAATLLIEFDYVTVRRTYQDCSPECKIFTEATGFPAGSASVPLVRSCDPDLSFEIDAAENYEISIGSVTVDGFDCSGTSIGSNVLPSVVIVNVSLQTVTVEVTNLRYLIFPLWSCNPEVMSGEVEDYFEDLLEDCTIGKVFQGWNRWSIVPVAS